MSNNNQNATVDQNAQAQSQQAQPQAQEQQQAQQAQPQQAQPQAQPQEPTSEPTYADLMKELAELKVDNRRLKKANDSLSSENGGLRKQVNAKLTEEELRAQQKSEKEEETAKRIAELEAKVAINEATKRYMSMGMPEEFAGKVAQSELNGDMDLVTASIKSFMDARSKEAEEKVRAELLAQMPVPISGNGDGQIDYETQYKEKLAAGDVQGAIHAQLMAAQQRAN